jgi:23S rRNA U2552 (ribose-2'-O)-methylase RlmE/FtsJ
VRRRGAGRNWRLGWWVVQGTSVIALDILPMEPLPGVEFIQGDFREAVVLERLLEMLN